ncbi:uncharacterized protein FAM241A isoform X3 [Anser cygnoides]|uniref:uncharacterized protein FAM241A isoform X3 n=1 Tax=Anser cygnoides TaxID=8845 RepID=UPI0034D25117
MPDSSRRATAAAHILGTDRQETSGRSKRKILKREQASPRRAPGGSGQETPRWTAVSEMGDIGMPFQQLLARSSQSEALPLQYIFHLTVDHLWKGYVTCQKKKNKNYNWEVCWRTPPLADLRTSLLGSSSFRSNKNKETTPQNP